MNLFCNTKDILKQNTKLGSHKGKKLIFDLAILKFKALQKYVSKERIF